MNIKNAVTYFGFFPLKLPVLNTGIDFYSYLTVKTTKTVIRFSNLTLSQVFLHHIFEGINRGPKNKHHTEQPGEIPNTQQKAVKEMSTMAIFRNFLFDRSLKTNYFCREMKRLTVKYIKNVTSGWFVGLHLNLPDPVYLRRRALVLASLILNFCYI